MKKIPKILKTALLLFVALLVQTSCDKDFYDNSFYQQQALEDIKVTKISFEKFNKKFQKLKKKPKIDNLMKSSKDIKQARTTNSSGVVIYTDDIKQVTMGDYTSYTMLMEFPNQSENKFYNITLEEKDGNTALFVTKYTPTEDYKANPKQAYQGEMANYRLEGEIEDINANTLSTFDGGGTSGGGGGVDQGIYAGAYTGGTLYDDPPYDCNGLVTSVVVEVEYPCACGHMPGEYCQGCPTGFPKFPGSTFVTKFQCNPMPYGNYNPNDPYPGGGSSIGGGSSSAGSSSSSGVGGAYTGGPTSVTTIVNPTQPEKPAPCDYLKNLSDESYFTSHVNYLANTITPLNQTEYGFAYLKDEAKNKTASGVPQSSNAGQINIKIVNNLYAAIHSHPMSTFPLFSFYDMVVLNTINEKIEPHNAGLATFLVVSKNDISDIQPNVYAIVLQDTGNLIPSITDVPNIEDIKKIIFDREEELYELYSDDSNKERAFLRFAQSYNIQLYKANPMLTNWKQLTLSSDLPDATVNSNDCN